MATTTKKQNTLTRIPKAITSGSRKAWLASLGAVATVGEEGSRLVRSIVQPGAIVNNLVERGSEFERTGRDQVETMAKEINERGMQMTQQMREEIGEAVEKAFNRADIRSSGDAIKSLSTKIEGLAMKVDMLAAELERREEQATGITTYVVRPEDDGWAVMKKGAQQPSSIHGTKAEAVEAARPLARKREPSVLVIMKQDGTIQEEVSYG